ncbi:MAG TPA: TetR/AcrR family transcriptional regulator [Caulobacteraceae bacterium]|jgi:AcrR family transcriptional regulator|nr:TetR/AcrR family transcriptional regulator [Caulobacteraceae bacterium]
MTISQERLEARRRQLVDAAHALIKETGSAGFSMLQLAKRAGVSPNTPYNLMGSKSELLRLMVRDDFERFRAKLTAAPAAAALDRLLNAIDLMVRHYTEDPGFYAGLHKAARSGESPEIGVLMAANCRSLWSGMAQAAVDAGELEGFVQVEPLTEALVRITAGAVAGWFALDWTDERFAREVRHAARLTLASVASPARRDRLVQDIRALQAALAAPDPLDRTSLARAVGCRR